MITFITHLQVSPHNASAFEALMTDVCAKVREHEAEGVPFYAFAHSVRAPNTYVVIEVYRDEASRSAHIASSWIQESLPKSAGLVEGGFESQQYVSPGTTPVSFE